MWNVENHLRYCLQKYCQPPLRWVSHLTGASQLGYIVQAVNSKDPLLFCLPSARIINISHQAQIYMWVLGIEVTHFLSPREHIIIADIAGQVVLEMS